MRKFGLSDRMLAVAKLVPYGTTACDVGCDHGFVAIYLVQEQICPKVIAMDINKGPLLRAREHIQEAGLSSYIEIRLSDGIKALKPGEADCMVAAGMGGRLIVKIMEDDPDKLKTMRYLVLQPQSELSFVRAFLRKQGFMIRKEDMVFEEGKFYPMMLAETGPPVHQNSGEYLHCQEGHAGKGKGCLPLEKTYAESLEDEFGPCLIREKHPVLLQYLSWWERQQNKILGEVLNHPVRKAEVERELERIASVREWMVGMA